MSHNAGEKHDDDFEVFGDGPERDGAVLVDNPPYEEIKDLLKGLPPYPKPFRRKRDANGDDESRRKRE